MATRTDTQVPAPDPARMPRSGRGGLLGPGVVALWLSLVVLLPLAALLVASLDGGPAAFWRAVTDPGALAALRITLLVSVVVTLVNVVAGVLIAWVLVRDDFRGKSAVNALIDLPFALPTIVASIVLLSLYGPESPIHLQLNATRPALVVALLFVTLPFVVRAVQPVLLELETDVEEAAASLGAGGVTTFRLVVLPALLPAILSGAGLAFTRAIGEYGSVVLIGGGIRYKTEVASQYIQKQIEADSPLDAAAVSVVLLAVAFLVLSALRLVSARAGRRGEVAP